MPKGTALAPGAPAPREALDVRQAARARPTEAWSTMSCAALPAGPPPGHHYVPLPLREGISRYAETRVQRTHGPTCVSVVCFALWPLLAQR